MCQPRRGRESRAAIEISREGDKNSRYTRGASINMAPPPSSRSPAWIGEYLNLVARPEVNVKVLAKLPGCGALGVEAPATNGAALPCNWPGLSTSSPSPRVRCAARMRAAKAATSHCASARGRPPELLPGPNRVIECPPPPSISLSLPRIANGRWGISPGLPLHTIILRRRWTRCNARVSCFADASLLRACFEIFPAPCGFRPRLGRRWRVLDGPRLSNDSRLSALLLTLLARCELSRAKFTREIKANRVLRVVARRPLQRYRTRNWICARIMSKHYIRHVCITILSYNKVTLMHGQI